MAQKVAAMDVRMAAALADDHLDVSAYCRRQGVSRQTFYKWRARFRAEGVDGLRERSRAPHHSPNATAVEVEELIVRVRKQLADDGADHGPDSVWSALPAAGLDGASVPSISTVARVLTRRGLVTPVPQRRPNSAMHRFVYARPNECWQSDTTRWRLSDGTQVAIAGTLDDHSRLIVGLAAAVGEETATVVWSAMQTALATWGIPQRSLTDNGIVYSGKRRNLSVEFETNLNALGVQTICSTPHHPQTCGKIERLWQTLKKWLVAHGPHPTIDALRTDLAVFVEYYNTRRPHRALTRATPAATYAATPAARPPDRPFPTRVVVRTTTVGSNGCISGHGNAQIGLGTAWTGRTVTTIRDGDLVTVLDGHRFLRAVTLQPGRRNYPADADYRTRRPRPTTP